MAYSKIVGQCLIILFFTEESMEKKTILKTKMLCKSFSNAGIQQHVLKNLNIEIYEKDFTVIMGSSGSGKSTLLYALSSMDKPTLGEVFFGELEISKLSEDKLAVFRRDHCGFVFQQIYLNQTMSVMDNILVSGYLVNKNHKEVLTQAKKLLLQVGIEETAWKKFASQLSGGEAQRVGIVRALINQPKIVFADEPTGALNSDSSKKVLDVLTEVNEQDQSVVMVTHDIKTASRGNRILYLRDGIVESELNLSYYHPEDKGRIKKIQEFLEEMGW